LGNRGFEKFDHVSRRFIHYSFVDEKGKSLNTWDDRIVFDNLNNLWIVKKNQVVKCTVIANAYLEKNIVQPIKIYMFPFLEDKMIFNISYIFSIYNGRHGVWVTSNNGLFLLKPANNAFIRYNKKIPRNEFSFKHPIIWSSIPDGLFVYNPKTGKTFHPNPNLTQNVETYFIDNNGSIWFGSLYINSQEGTGLNKIITTGKFFRHYLTPTQTKEEVAVFGLFKDKNRDIWVGTNNYNYLLTLHPDGTFEKGNFLPDELVQLGGQARTFIEDNHGGLWIGYINGALFRYDYFRKTFERCHLKKYPYIQNKDDFLSCFKILNLDKKGNIWAGGDKGFLHFNSLTLTVDFYKQINDNGIYSMLNDEEGNQWVGMAKSQLLFKGKDNKQDIQIYRVPGRYNIEYIVEGDNHDLWLALLGGGICRFDKLTHQSKIYTTKDGLANNTTYNILKDKKGNLWISSNTGISRFNPRTGLFRNFSKSDGLKIVEFNADAACQTKEGEMLFGGMGGFVSFYPDSLDKKEKNNKTPLLFTGFKVSGRERYFNQPIYETNEIHLQKGDNNFEISFASVDFVNAEKIRYRYCLQGYKNEWINTDSRNRIVNYASLPPGRYTF
jgi:ligand-binding sensor domain-containing protein